MKTPPASRRSDSNFLVFRLLPSAMAIAAVAFLLLPPATAQTGAKAKKKPKNGGNSTFVGYEPSREAVDEAGKGDWSRWRGPAGDAVSAESDLLTEWPAEGPPLAWEVNDIGGGMSSVAVSNGRIFTMGKKGDDVRLVARNVSDGQELWATPIANDGDPNCTPTVDGDRVYAISHDGTLVCCSVKDGKILWKKSFSQDFGGRMHSGWGYSESPLVDGDKLICTPGAAKAMLAALDKMTGKTIWMTPLPDGAGNKGSDGAGYASPVISNAGGVKQYITLVGRGIISADAKTGELLWGYNQVANGTANIPTPLINGDYVFCSSGYGDGGTALLKITKKGKKLNAEEVYWKSSNELQNHHGGMVMLGDYVYFGEGHNQGLPVCVEWKTGKQLWGKQRGAGADSAAVAFADNHLYFRYQNGVMALINTNPKKYELVSKFKIPGDEGPSWPHPVIAGGKLYLRAGDRLLAYDIHK
jgi:outer membrane protein assembly factor BamB